MSNLSQFMDGKVLKTVGGSYGEFFLSSTGLKVTITPSSNQYVQIFASVDPSSAEVQASFGGNEFFDGEPSRWFGNINPIGGKGEAFTFNVSVSDTATFYYSYQLLEEA